MATTPTPNPSGFNWQLLLGAVEAAGNTATAVLIPGGAAFEPLLAQLESAINPLLMSIGQKQPVTNEAMLFFSTTIGVLTILKNKPGMPADTLGKVDEYLTGAQNGLAAYMRANLGFDPSLFTPVTPIA